MKRHRFLAAVILALAVGWTGAAGQDVAPDTSKVERKNRAPVSKEVLRVNLPRATERTLSNGLTVLILEDHRLPFISLQYNISAAGPIFEPSDMPGLASVTAQMLREGTKTKGSLQIAEEIARHMKHSPVILAGLTTLGQLMGLIKECKLLVTNDSGPMHLGAALGVPQVAIFGSTSEEATGPLSARARVVKHPVECSPCFLRECPIDFRCMTRITAEDVFSVAEEMLAPRKHSFDV